MMIGELLADVKEVLSGFKVSLEDKKKNCNVVHQQTTTSTLYQLEQWRTRHIRKRENQSSLTSNVRDQAISRTLQ